MESTLDNDNSEPEHVRWDLLIGKEMFKDLE